MDVEKLLLEAFTLKVEEPLFKMGSEHIDSNRKGPDNAHIWTQVKNIKRDEPIGENTHYIEHSLLYGIHFTLIKCLYKKEQF